MPQLGETVSEGTVTRWLRKQGDTITADEPLVEIQTDKVSMEVPALRSGVLLEILVEEGQTVPVGAALAWMEADGSGTGATPLEEVATMLAEAPPAPDLAADAGAGAEHATDTTDSPAAGGSRPERVRRHGDRTWRSHPP